VVRDGQTSAGRGVFFSTGRDHVIYALFFRVTDGARDHAAGSLKKKDLPAGVPADHSRGVIAVEGR
jgi:hypothetical protein